MSKIKTSQVLQKIYLNKHIIQLYAKNKNYRNTTIIYLLKYLKYLNFSFLCYKIKTIEMLQKYIHL